MALLILVAMAPVLSLKLEPIAEQLAMIVYFSLLIGASKEFWALRSFNAKAESVASIRHAAPAHQQ